MQRHRFYANPSQVGESKITLDENESQHLARVLRLKPGDVVFAFDGEGLEWECEVSKADRISAELSVIQRLDNVVESSLQLTIGQALIKGDKFDWVVQKTTELGVSRIVPLITENCDVRIEGDRKDNRLLRWRRLALEAVKQCGRRRLVEITEPLQFSEFCSMAEKPDTGHLRLFFSERIGTRFVEYHDCDPETVTIAIGPEGGWSKEEHEIAERHNFDIIHLGNRILRTDTAAITATALVQHQFGDI